MKRLILFFAIVFLGAGLRAASVLPVGEGKFTYKDYPPFADRPVDVHYYIPASGDVRRMPIVFVFEGADRGFTYLLKAWKQEAEKHKFMVFIPHFDLERFPLPDYQEVGVMNDKDHTIRPAEKQTPALVMTVRMWRKPLSAVRDGTPSPMLRKIFPTEYATFRMSPPKQSGSTLPNRLSSNWLRETPSANRI